jgi:queuine/archaeosine tRNA-ribosyltransferase
VEGSAEGVVSAAQRSLATRRGTIRFPAYIPVTTYGGKYPLDDLLRPYLPRLAPAVMVSHYYARRMDSPPRVPLWVDSGGFVSLREGARVLEQGRLGMIEVQEEAGPVVLHPREVLDLQEEIADVAFTLDFPVPPGTEPSEARRRLELTIANAEWARDNRRRRDLPLYACVQGWDVESARECARAYATAGFEGAAVGGLVPRVRDRKLVLSMVEAVRQEIGDLPLHVFGLGKPDMVEDLFGAGVDSVDSSAYVQLAAEGRLWSDSTLTIPDPSPTDRLHLALCNLAYATGKTLPLSAAKLAFATASLAGHGRIARIRKG